MINLACVIITDTIFSQMAWAIGSLTGPIIGGAVAEHTTWRWIFYLNFPICGYSLLAIPILLTLKPPTATFSEKLKRVDWLGGFLFIGSMVTFLVGISWGGNDFPWRSAQTLVPVFIGAAGLTVTLFYEHSYARYPFLKKILFTDRSAITVYVLGLLQGFIVRASHKHASDDYWLTSSSSTVNYTTSPSTSCPSRSTAPPWPV